MPAPTLDKIYEHLWAVHVEEPFAGLDRSLSPRSPDILYEVVERLDLAEGGWILEAGCGQGVHACELARRLGRPVVGVDLVRANPPLARDRARAAGHPRLPFLQSSIDRLPFRDGAFRLLWCRDALPHVRPLDRALRECARVLQPDGRFLLHTTFATERMEPRELDRLCGPLGVVGDNFDRTRVEAQIAAAGLRVLSSESIGSEWREYSEEQQGLSSRQLLRAARMIRRRERFETELGSRAYHLALAVYHWDCYELLGKLDPVVYVLARI